MRLQARWQSNGASHKMMSSSKRSGGGAFRDPIVGLAVPAVGLPLISLMHTVGTASGSFSCFVPHGFFLALWVVLLAACVCAAIKPVLKISRVARAAFNRSQALKDLPGPEYGLLGILGLLRTRKDLHRQVTEWAEQYGPIYRVRVVIFHVCHLVQNTCFGHAHMHRFGNVILE